MSRDELLPLAERCERATGPDRELDCRITAAAHPSMSGEFHVVGPPTYVSDRYFSGQEGIDWIGYDLLNTAPAYTASIDAAMTLVPEGAVWGLSCDDERPGMFLATVMPIRPPDHTRYCATPALALTAACLRARAAQEAEVGEG